MLTGIYIYRLCIASYKFRFGFAVKYKLFGGCFLELYWSFGISDKLWIGFFIPFSSSAHSHTHSHYIHMCTCSLCTSNIIMSFVVKQVVNIYILRFMTDPCIVCIGFCFLFICSELIAFFLFALFFTHLLLFLPDTATEVQNFSFFPSPVQTFQFLLSVLQFSVPVFYSALERQV